MITHPPRVCTETLLIRHVVAPRPEGRKSCLVLSQGPPSSPLSPLSPGTKSPSIYTYIYIYEEEAIARCCVQCNYENLRVFCFNRQSALFSFSRLLYFGENNLRSAKVFSQLNAEKHPELSWETSRRGNCGSAMKG